MGFEYFDHTADIGIRAWGDDLADAFTESATALVSLTTDPGELTDVVSVDLSVEASDLESLLIGWLNELIYRFEVEGFLPHRYQISSLSETNLTATCWGEKVDPTRHQLKTAVKAATYHNVLVERQPTRWLAQVIVDV